MKDSNGNLSALEVESIEYFISFTRLIGLPKSVGEVYGVLFVAAEPINSDDLMHRLGISKGGISQSLKLLRELGVVDRVYVAGDRRDHYRADFRVSQIVNAFVGEHLLPRLKNGEKRIERMRALAAELPSDEKRSTNKRLDRLKAWQDRGKRVLGIVHRYMK